MLGTLPPWRLAVRWLLAVTFLLFAAQTQAVSLPAAAVAASQTQSGSTQEPSVDEKKAAWAALANILQNDQSRQELITQLRSAANSPSDTKAPVLTPPAEEEDKTVLESVTDVSRHFGGEFLNKFKKLHRNIVSAPHKPFNHNTFFNALSHFAMLAVALFAFYWLICRAITPVYRRMGQWGRQKNSDRTNWLHLPAMIIGAFILDLLLLALALFVGQMLSDSLNAGSRTIAYQQGLFLNAFALIEFFKAILRLIFCPRYPQLRFFHLADERAFYWNTRLSWLSSVIGYGLLVIVPIVSNQVNVQVAALVNIVLMGLITGWALYLIFHNRRSIQQDLGRLADRSMSFFSLFIRAFAAIWHWLASAYFIALFLLSIFNPGDSLKFMMSATVR